MARIPAPEPGLVIHYGYVWKREADAGADAARKDRPACIVLAVASGDAGTRVLVVPVTHQRPQDGTPAIEIPPKVKLHLGLDQNRSWIILSEANLDEWPSPDLRPLLGDRGRFHYGFLPDRLFQQVRAEVRAILAAKQLGVVKRSV